MSKEYNLKIEGMTCVACTQIIEESAKKIPGIQSVEVNFATEKALLKTEDFFSIDLFLDLMMTLGYRAIDPSRVDDLHGSNKNLQKLYHAIISLVVGAIMMAISMGPLSALVEHRTSNGIQLVAAFFILAFYGKGYFYSLVHFIKSGLSNMNTLIALGLVSAFVYSVTLMLFDAHAHVYFETIPFIVGFSQLGLYFDELAKTKARSSLSSLYKMQVKVAVKLTPTGEQAVPVIELKKGDRIRVRPGDKIPLDAFVVEGVSHCDESMLTGESQNVVKHSGSKVFAGSFNLDGVLVLEVINELHHTFISSLVAFVERSQLVKAPIQKYADRLIRFFVPSIIVLSFLTFVVWWIYLNPTATNDRSYQAFSHMIAVLLIACPCALGLAVPMAVMIATTSAVKHGLLIGGGAVIEKAHSIDTIIFDKTGTLTAGKPLVTAIHSMIDQKRFITFAASVCQFSNHPLSKAIVSYAQAQDLVLDEPQSFKSIPGAGIESKVNNELVLIGNREWISSQGIFVEEAKSLGSHVYVALSGKVVGYFTISDPIKEKAFSTIKELKDLGFEIWMVSGDNHEICNNVAEKLGITNVKSEVKPIAKAEFVNQLKSQSKNVAMIGDGINDAPALSNADLSLAMSGGADVAVEASEVTIIDGKIENIVHFFKLSKKTMSIIKQNLFFSFGYNVLCLPLAAGVFYPLYGVSLSPVWASAAMGLSSLSVILSSLRLKRPL